MKNKFRLAISMVLILNNTLDEWYISSNQCSWNNCR
jgi:hypothetical protein